MKEMAMEKTRSCEIEMELDGTVEQVWKALTDAEELSRWFPPSAKVEPGEGGSIHLSWAPYVESDNRIMVWDPPRHLRTGWFDSREGVMETPGTPEEARQLAVDYYIESREGKTVLRLVHSGFSTAAEWDEEYDGVRRGWTYELRSLRHYLKNHFGKDRRIAWARKPIEARDQEAWDRLMSTDGLLQEGSLEGLKEGDRYSITTAGGDSFEGTVLVNEPPQDFSATVDRFGGAILRVGIESCSGAREVHLWLSGWEMSEVEIKTREEKLNGLLSTLFPGG